MIQERADLQAFLKGKRIVPGKGNLKSPLWLIGEAPGAREEELLIPFIGPSGQELSRMLQVAGEFLDSVYRDNVVPVRPPNNKLQDLGIPIENFYEPLALKIEKFRPNVIVALGEHALRALCGEMGIAKFRGSILESTLVPGIKVIPTYHPAYVLREYTVRNIVIFDLKRALRESKFQETKRPARNLVIKPSFPSAIDELLMLKERPILSIDIETRGNRIACIALSHDPSYAISIPLEKKDYSSFYTLDEEMEIWLLLSDILTNEKIEKVIQNVSFDGSFIYFHHIPLRGKIWDTMWMHNLLWPEFPHSLAFMTSIYTSEPYYKDDGKHWEKWMGEESFWIYNAKDAAVTFEIFLALREEMKRKNLDSFYEKHYQRLQYPLLKAQVLGFRIDEKRRGRMRKKWEMLVEEKQKRLDDIVGHPLNVNSPKQMATFLYGELKLPVQRVHGTSKVTTREDALDALFMKTRKPILNDIQELRQARKFLSSYLNDRQRQSNPCILRPHRLRTLKGWKVPRLNRNKLTNNSRNWPLVLHLRLEREEEMGQLDQAQDSLMEKREVFGIKLSSKQSLQNIVTILTNLTTALEEMRKAEKRGEFIKAKVELYAYTGRLLISILDLCNCLRVDAEEALELGWEIFLEENCEDEHVNSKKS
jgi:DNA polymerase